MKRHHLILRGGATCFLMVFHAILRQIFKYCCCAISSRELSVRAIFCAFYDYGFSGPKIEVVDQNGQISGEKKILFGRTCL